VQHYIAFQYVSMRTEDASGGSGYGPSGAMRALNSMSKQRNSRSQAQRDQEIDQTCRGAHAERPKIGCYVVESKWNVMLLSPAARRRVVGAASTWTKNEDAEKVNETKEASKQVNSECEYVSTHPL
jgi:hypothetical protein